MRKYKEDGYGWELSEDRTTLTRIYKENDSKKIPIYDLAGNCTYQSVSVSNIDKTAPIAGTLTMKLGTSEGNKYTNDTWTNQNVYIELNSGYDSESGHKSTRYSVKQGEEIIISNEKEPQILTETGEYTIIVTTEDAAGNISTNEYMVKINVTVEGLKITTNPNKTHYNAYEKFNLEGMVVKITYSNGKEEIISESEYKIINGENLTCQSSNIEIQYKENPEIKAELTVNVAHDMQEPTCIEESKCQVQGCTHKIEGSALGHDYETTVVEPTCITQGYTTHKCTRCEDSYVDTYTEELNHKFTNYVSNNDATCTEDGTKTAKCDRCDETHTIPDEGSKIPHDYENGECKICGQKEQKLEITSEKYIIQDLYISKIQPKTTIKEFKEQIQTNSNQVKLYNNGKEIEADDEIIKTGMQIEIKFAEKTKTLTLAVDGDVNGDGKADFKDIVSMNKHKLNKKKLNEVELIAGDVNNDNKVDFKDIVKVNKYRLNKITIL